MASFAMVVANLREGFDAVLRNNAGATRDEIRTAVGAFCAKHGYEPKYPDSPIRLHYKDLLGQYAINYETIAVHPQQYAVVLKPTEGAKGVWIVTFDTTAAIADHLDACRRSIDDVIAVIDLETNATMPVRSRVYIG